MVPPGYELRTVVDLSPAEGLTRQADYAPVALIVIDLQTVMVGALLSYCASGDDA